MSKERKNSTFAGVHPQELIDYVLLFNERRFFEAHEALETLWLKEKDGPARDFYQGLIQMAAAWVHFERGTPDGGKRLLGTASQYFKNAGTLFRGIDAEKLIMETESCLKQHKVFPQIELRPFLPEKGKTK